MSVEATPWVRRTVRLPDSLWRRVNCLRHRRHIERFNEALCQVVEVGLDELERESELPPEPATDAPKRKRAQRTTVRLLAYLLFTVCAVSGWQAAADVDPADALVGPRDYLSGQAPLQAELLSLTMLVAY